MPKAVVNTKSGATITIEGTRDEVADLLRRLDTRGSGGGPSRSQGFRRSENGSRPKPTGLLAELIDEGFFGQPKDLGAVRGALQEKGHFYPATTLSPLMLRLVRKRELRRIPDKGRWTYAR